ncbi:MAG: TIORF127 protein [uncultured Thermomicrobiales bacterium]|uniref:TIORF127 protein n=1 Tax=uncultured Thermomicrobiales bacterium TaxID=1645740 RepID=A0A6J4UQ24_9BACT|nr:MAG: TIORF127 protein [uncultured Thermomicrobiales bacterium]
MVQLWGEHFTKRQLLEHAGRLPQVGGVRLVELADGLERGTRVLEFRTGSGFQFDVMVDRAMDVGRCELNGLALGWQSNAGFPGPWSYEPEGLGWLRGFGGGLLTTCGLEHALFMAEDSVAQYNYPAFQTKEFGLHGRVSYLPARLTGYGERWEGDACTLWAAGEIVQAAVFAEQLVLRRRVEARLGESRLFVHDEVENIGNAPTPHMYLYHVNVGFPVLDDGAELLVPATDPKPRGGHPVEGYTRFHGPRAGYTEEVTEHAVKAEAGGTVPVAVVNRARGIGAYEVFDRAQLPHHFIWRMLGQGTYVVGIEPSTNRTAGRLDAKAKGELIVLEPGETRRYDLELGALAGAAEIDAFAARVAGCG